MQTSKVLQIFILAIVGLGLFMGGWVVGSGRVTLSFWGKELATENPQLPERLDFNSVQQVYNALRVSFDGQLEEQALLDGMKEGLARATGDPHTEYLNAEAAREFNDDLNGTFEGIGAELSKDKEFIVVVAPISGFPAEKAGVLPRDVIAAIDDESTFDMSLTEAVSKIRGPAGTSVRLRVLRGGEELQFDIMRQNITLPSVEYDLVGNIGYIEIARFAEDTGSLARKAATELKKQGADSIILDLRGNPGGMVHAAADVASLWLEPGTSVVEERRGGKPLKTYTAKGQPVLAGLPTVVLINGGSASSSEIVAGALQDYEVATVIGEESFGKGSVQQLERIPSGGVLKVTIARWYTPDGRNIDKEGIAPNQEVLRTAQDYVAGRDPQKDAAIGVLQN